eukprot:TRINITY_DN11005_c0_g1_i1.p1 TRINITY_DN11005_c0_g1~~TRINITY_DN11005_c0_g1_i1.p1  ORF type:complete len:544 (-),score=155.62 TRINITY_DN11005_c0_g1_i1:273-1904(-)
MDESSSDDELLNFRPIIARPKAAAKPNSEYSFESVLLEVQQDIAMGERLKQAESTFKVDMDILYAPIEVQPAKPLMDSMDDVDEDSVDIKGLVSALRPAAGAIPHSHYTFSNRCPAAAEAPPQLQRLNAELQRTDACSSDELLDLLSDRTIAQFLLRKKVAPPPYLVEWLLRVVAFHPDGGVTEAAVTNIRDVIAAAATLSALTSPANGQHAAQPMGITETLLQDFYEAAGAAWLSETDETDATAETDDDADTSAAAALPPARLWTNVDPFLQSLALCLCAGWHALSADALSDLAVTLAALSVDRGVAVACHSAAQAALVAVFGAMPEAWWGSDDALGGLVAKLEDLAGECHVDTSVETCVHVARHITSDTPRSRQLQAAYAHSTLLHTLLADTAYAREQAAVRPREAGLVQALAAITVLRADIDTRGLREGGRFGPARQYAVLGCAQALVESTLVPPQPCQNGAASGEAQTPNRGQLLTAIAEAAEGLSSRMKDIMQADVRKCKDLLSMLSAECTGNARTAPTQSTLKGFFNTSAAAAAAVQ